MFDAKGSTCVRSRMLCVIVTSLKIISKWVDLYLTDASCTWNIYLIFAGLVKWAALNAFNLNFLYPTVILPRTLLLIFNVSDRIPFTWAKRCQMTNYPCFTEMVAIGILLIWISSLFVFVVLFKQYLMSYDLHRASSLRARSLRIRCEFSLLLSEKPDVWKPDSISSTLTVPAADMTQDHDWKTTECLQLHGSAKSTWQGENEIVSLPLAIQSSSETRTCHLVPDCLLGSCSVLPAPLWICPSLLARAAALLQPETLGSLYFHLSAYLPARK